MQMGLWGIEKYAISEHCGSLACAPIADPPRLHLEAFVIPATHLDLYQLSSLVCHFDAERAQMPVTMSFFARRLPQDNQGRTVRGHLLWVGLRRCLDWLARSRFDEARMQSLLAHPMLGPALKDRPDLEAMLRAWRFHGEIDAPPEGTPIFAGQPIDAQGQPLHFDDVQPAAQAPFMVVQTDLLSAKLIETPLLSIINHQTMVASKAARVVAAAGERQVLEFGSRRVHPEAAVDAAYAAWVAGVAGTSNVEAYHRHGIPASGTMDHFAVQAWEREGVARHETERAFFKAFHEVWPEGSILLVDTYDAYGPLTGIPNAVAATGGKLAGIRLDSRISVENVRRARQMLDHLGAPQARIVVSGGVDEHSVRAWAEAPIDAFGIGERLVSSADAPVGVGAVAKLCEVQGQPTMKLARGSAKATLPGRVQVYRQNGQDTVACHDEVLPGEPLLRPVWRGAAALPQPSVAETRSYALAARAQLTDAQRGLQLEGGEAAKLVLSEGMQARIWALVRADAR